MRQVMLVCLLLVLLGCTSRAGRKSGPPSQGEPVPVHTDKEPSGSLALEIVAINVRGGEGETRLTLNSREKTLPTSGEVNLRVEVTNLSSKGLIEWFFEGMYSPGEGRLDRDEYMRLIKIGEGNEISWSPGPGTNGRLWLNVWGEAIRGTRAGVQSWPLYMMRPMDPVTECPTVHLPRPEGDVPSSAGQTVMNNDLNMLTIDWLGERYLIPLSANPDTCVDPLIAARLKNAGR
jgi:hypothetical protein